MTLLCAGGPIAHAVVESPHLAQHRVSVGRFIKLLDGNPAGAMKFALAAVANARRLADNDPLRGDALELLCLAHQRAEDFYQALPLAAEVVRLRRIATPPEPELLGLALGNLAVSQFALGRGAAADAALTEQLQVWRRAFGPLDLRRAEKLEGMAEQVQKGFGRRQWVIDLLREAVAIRQAQPVVAGGRLAATLQELATHEMLQQEHEQADADLALAGSLLDAESRKDPANEEIKAGLVQILASRAGLAAVRGRIAQGLALAKAAQAFRFKNRVLQAESALLAIAAQGEVMSMAGDIDAAIAAQFQVFDIVERYSDLVASGALDTLTMADALSSLARLYLRKPDLALARLALAGARKYVGDTAELLFLLSDLERQDGHADLALSHYRRALSLRKESATEARVLFGTSRMHQKDGRFGAAAGPALTFGRADVLVPGAQFSDNAWLKAPEPTLPVGRATDVSRLLIRDTRPLDSAHFSAEATGMLRSATLYPRAALVFVHGFNVSFDEALQRAAQLKRDLNFDGAMFVFSWPSQGSMFKYATDKVTADASAQALLSFLQAVESATGAENIHVIAHSMGNRILLPALAMADSTLRGRLREVILAAPAVPRAEFLNWLDAIAGRGPVSFTLYASAADKAMWAGWFGEHAKTLAGFSSDGRPPLHGGVQSIDISKAASPGLLAMNHDVFTSNPVMNEDMRQLLQQGRRTPPDQRLPVLKARRDGAGPDYWVYEPAPDPGR